MNRILMVFVCGLCCLPFASAQNDQSAPASAPPPQVVPTDAKNHIGQTVTVCGKVADAKVNKYGIAGRGKPVLFYIDQPEATADFYFIAFGTKEGGPDEVTAAYNGKSLCVTGKVAAASGQPYIAVTDRSTIKVKP
jgi:hypothetical protein